MKRLIIFLSLCLCFITNIAQAMLSLELTQGVAGAIPIAVVPFVASDTTLPQNISTIVTNDLQNSGRFKVFDGNAISTRPSAIDEVNYKEFQKIGANNIVIGQIHTLADNRYEVRFQLLDTYHTKGNNPLMLNQKYVVSSNELRPLAHHISDLIYQKITGTRGIFSTRLAYVVVQRSNPTKYTLEVADQDGYNPKPLLNSFDPIMSPSWSPNGKQVAYVSFEKQRAAIYVQDVATGTRHLVSEFPGINGAPAWSPDGRKLALVLSKSGAPNLYTLDLASHQLTQLTRDFYINTEPAWSPRGNKLIFTSNRGGNNPQVYELNLANKNISRVTYNGAYNARPSYTPDGNHIVMINRDSGLYNIGILDLDNGNFKVLTQSKLDHGSPSIAPNGSMVVFEMYDRGRNLLGMVTTDGTINLSLPARNGEVQDPAWSPFLS